MFGFTEIWHILWGDGVNPQLAPTNRTLQNSCDRLLVLEPTLSATEKFIFGLESRKIELMMMNGRRIHIIQWVCNGCLFDGWSLS